MLKALSTFFSTVGLQQISQKAWEHFSSEGSAAGENRKTTIAQ